MKAKQNSTVMSAPLEAVGDAATRAHPEARLAPGAAVLTSVLAGCAARAAAALASSSLKISCKLPPAAHHTLTSPHYRKGKWVLPNHEIHYTYGTLPSCTLTLTITLYLFGVGM